MQILALTPLFAPRYLQAGQKAGHRDSMIIDDFSRTDLVSARGTRWRGVTDQVMGGVSEAALEFRVIDGRAGLHLTGDVRLENNGGFVQAALDLEATGGTLDGSGFRGVRLVVRGNGERYAVHLRTPDNLRPWQSYRAPFLAKGGWRTIDLPFAAFTAHRLETPLDVSRLRRIGLVAIGRAFRADLAVADLRLFR